MTPNAHLAYCVVAFICAAVLTLVACFSEGSSSTVTPVMFAMGLVMAVVAIGQRVHDRRQHRDR